MIVNGYDLNNELIFEIGRFSILWNLFERFQCDNNCNSRAIKDVCSCIGCDDTKQSKLAQVLNERCRLFCQDISNYVDESLHPGNSRQSSQEDKEIMQNYLKQEGDELLRGCLLVIYRIRNNLMHGMKCVEELNNQLTLFKAVNEVLESINNS